MDSQNRRNNPIISTVQFLAILSLMIGIFRMPPNYYSFLRCVMVLACVATIYDSIHWTIARRSKWFLISVFALLALLFNPVFLCTFYRTTWGFIDLVGIAALFWAFSATREDPDNGQYGK